MTYDEFIELLGEYCEYDIDLSVISFINTMKQLTEQKIVTITRKKTANDIEEEIRNNNSICYLTERGVINAIAVNIDNNTILIKKINDNTIKILGISKQTYSSLLIYVNMMEVW